MSATDIEVVPADEQQRTTLQPVTAPIPLPAPTTSVPSPEKRGLFGKKDKKDKNVNTYPPQSPRDPEEDEQNPPSPSPPSSSTKEADKDKDGDYARKEKKGELQPCSITELFRFATPAENIANCVSLIAAAAAGAAQPLMSLIFSNLTQQFIVFGETLTLAQSGNATAAAALPSAVAAFRSTAAQDASQLVYIGVGIFACTFIYMYTWVYTGEVGSKRLREGYLRAVLRQDVEFFDGVGAGEVATRIMTDTLLLCSEDLVQQGTSEKVALCVEFLAAFVAAFILAYVRNWRLALALSSILPCIAIAGAVMTRAVSGYTAFSLRHISAGGTVAEEVIGTIRTAQAFGIQKVLAELYDTHVEESRKVDAKAAMWQGGGLAFSFFVIYSAYGLSFNFGATLINQGHATPGSVVNVFFAILIGAFSLGLLAPEMQAVTHARGAAAKLYETIDRVPSIDSASKAGLKPEGVEGLIQLESVSFTYPSCPTVPIVKDLSISFAAGKTAALVGASGSGKSTIVALVERFYDPQAGRVTLDGRDIRDLNVKWLRTQIGLVSQEPVLFATTIRQNVAHGLIGTPHERAGPEAQFELIKEACVKANADGFIGNMPMGYDTMVGERGILMSGGQKQRIAIARAIVGDPRVLLLDEATSALDTQSEGIVQDALDKAAAGRTTITIAHRLSTIKDAECIYVMGEGCVIEQGTHAELLAGEGGAYSKLVEAQKLHEQKEAQTAEDAGNKMAEEGKVEVPAEDIKIGLEPKSMTQPLASEIVKKRGKLGSGNVEAGSRWADEDMGLWRLFRRLAEVNQAGWKNYALGFVAACLTGMVYPAFSAVYATGISSFSQLDPHTRQYESDRVALWFFIIALGSTLTIGVQNFLFAAAAAELSAKLRALSFRAILRQDIEFFDRDENSTGSLTSRLSDNPQKVNGLAGVTLGTIVQSFAIVIAGSVLGLIFVWKLALVGIACMPLVISAGYIRLNDWSSPAQRVVVLKDQTNKKEHADSAQIACEAAGAIRTVASLTREDQCVSQYSESLEVPLKNSNRTALWSNLLYSLSQAMSLFVIALSFWYGSRLISNLEFSTFDFFIGFMSTVFGALQAGAAISFVPDISYAKGAGSDIFKLLDSMPEIDAESGKGKPVSMENVRGHVRLENIHFRYPTRPDVRVLRDLSITIEPGTYIALVGASGSGKSTVIQMIERFYDPLAGKIYLDDELITNLNLQEYRKQIALVSQEPTLYAGTVRFNILLGAIKPIEEVTQEEIEQACRNANILDFIRSLPDGFNTEVGGKGSQLSGGQKQRIAIARALLRNPKVLLLDEATSALDSNSEKVVQDALDTAAKGRTTIAIAHRLSTIQDADCIYFIKEGTVCESGTHDQLLQQRGAYYEYVQLQALSKRD
ncbi:P-loop containing nucleoside triphosphate hydrolase protein [Athelia psychrophila]|uniref:P-loop containing nucleoside triphosphate hydrolase protein n=1 Tax=Athelia psychrophila TaxID=1759441 RepID=A0A166SRI1_9AGAM|nr:P-loop containing nucleoside triphosphate hydrolase protein [Fibularhizoctonia sp. CBS 109695]